MSFEQVPLLEEVIQEWEFVIVNDTEEDDKENVWEPELQESEVQHRYENNLCSKKNLQLKGNYIPRSLVPMEKLNWSQTVKMLRK